MDKKLILTPTHKITPGTWEAIETHGSLYVGRTTVITRPTGNMLALTHIWGMQDYAEGNALLIAAAPDLLEACKAAAKALCEGSAEEQAEAFNQACAAMWKAEGVDLP